MLPVALGGAVSLAGTAVSSFVATNVDTAAVLLPSLWAVPGGTARRRAVIACTLGGALVIVCATMVAIGLSAVPVNWARWSGLLPIAIGLWRLLRCGDAAQALADTAHTGFAAWAGLTASLGTDNIAVLGLLLRALGGPRAAAMGLAQLILLATLLSIPLLTGRARRSSHPLARRAAACVTIAVGTRVLWG
jgi:cadmium resistance protein CadD (predicted permease)